MAFRLPSSNWQEPNGYERVLGDAHCCVCLSTHDLGYSPEHMYELLVEHTALTLKNCSRIRTPAATYDEAIQLYAAELSKRLQAHKHHFVFTSDHDEDEHVTKLFIQPMEVGASCSTDVVKAGGMKQTIERYEIRRTL